MLTCFTRAWSRLGMLIALSLTVSPLPLHAEDAMPVDVELVSSGATDTDKALLEKLAPSLAVAQVTVRADAGELPESGGWSARCPNCGRFHNLGLDRYLNDERPLELPAFVIAADTVIVPDPLVSDRFVESIKVRLGEGKAVDAVIERVAIAQRAVVLKLASPLPGATPLVFAPGDASDLRSVHWTQGNGRWSATVSRFGTSVTRGQSGVRRIAGGRDVVVVAPDGTARGLVFSESLPVDDSWMGSPLNWPARSVNEDQQLLQRLTPVVAGGIVRVHLILRSPTTKDREDPMYFRSGDDEQDNLTERYVSGVVVSDNRVLVLAPLKPDATARLERIHVYSGDSAAVAATFLASLQDYGALVVQTEQPLPTVMKFATDDPEALLGRALVLADVRIAGESRTDRLTRARIPTLELGWRGNLYPEIPLSDEREKTAFIIDDTGSLVALPLPQRPKPQAERAWGGDPVTVTFARQLQDVVADPIAHSDPANIPLSEAEQNRIAWLGVELQALTPDLARMNKVSAFTRDGKTGALVTYLYPASPAEQAGIKVGDVLLSVQSPALAKPIDITTDPDALHGREFPWAHYDQMPEMYFDQIPQPWPSAASTLARTLTEIGLGKTVKLELFQDGQRMTRSVMVTQSPPHFDSAERLKDAQTGLTLRAMTFEVRRYFQRAPDAPGLIISAIEQGSRASKAGLKPFEFITSVNGQPVHTPTDFSVAMQGKSELRLDVTRMNKSRVVKLKLPASKLDADQTGNAPSSTQPADEAPTTAPLTGEATQSDTATQ